MILLLFQEKLKILQEQWKRTPKAPITTLAILEGLNLKIQKQNKKIAKTHQEN
jgi:hypothetical protein